MCLHASACLYLDLIWTFIGFSVDDSLSSLAVANAVTTSPVHLSSIVSSSYIRGVSYTVRIVQSVSVQEVALHVEADTYDAYLRARDRVREAAQAAQAAAEMRAFEERLRKELNDQITPVRNTIIEGVLTLHCPRCMTAFLDFDGCLALSCARAGCGCGFCGVCLKDCGGDAHGHLGTCKYSNSRLHANTNQLQGLQNLWRTDRIKEVCLLAEMQLGPQVDVSTCSLLAHNGPEALPIHSTTSQAGPCTIGCHFQSSMPLFECFCFTQNRARGPCGSE